MNDKEGKLARLTQILPVRGTYFEDCNLYEDQAPIEEIFGWLIFRWGDKDVICTILYRTTSNFFL